MDIDFTTIGQIYDLQKRVKSLEEQIEQLKIKIITDHLEVDKITMTCKED
jgi:hypothetical protein